VRVWAPVVLPIILVTWEAEIGHHGSWPTQAKSSQDPILTNKLNVVAHSNLHRRLRSRGPWFQASWDKKAEHGGTCLVIPAMAESIKQEDHSPGLPSPKIKTISQK
jgi:hypothetical protein